MKDASTAMPGLAAITFSDHGGGIASVSRLVRQVLTERHGDALPTLALASDDLARDVGTFARVRFGARLTKLQALARCDWMLFTHLGLATAQARVPSVFRRPYAVFLYDIEAWTPLSPFRRDVLRGAFLRLAISRYTARRVEAANPGCGPIDVCHLALPDDRPVSSADVRGVDSVNRRSVVIVARMASGERYKGHDQLIDAWPRVMQAVPDATLVCVGEGDDVARLRQRAEASGVAHAIRFPGFVDRAVKAAIYERAGVLAMPSQREGFGLVYLEAMAAGMPCIGSTQDASGEVILDGQTGYLVHPDDRDLLAARLITLLSDEPVRAALGAAGRRRYDDTFGYEHFRDRVQQHVLHRWNGGRVASAPSGAV